MVSTALVGMVHIVLARIFPSNHTRIFCLQTTHLHLNACNKQSFFNRLEAYMLQQHTVIQYLRVAYGSSFEESLFKF